MSSCPNCDADLQASDETCPVCEAELSGAGTSKETYAEEESSDLAWYDKGWVVGLWLFFFLPVGVYALYRNKSFNTTARRIGWGASIFIGLLYLGAIVEDPDTQETVGEVSTAPQDSAAQKDLPSLIDQGSPTAPDWHPVDSTAVEGMWPFTVAEGKIGCVVDTEPEIAGDATNEVKVPLFRTSGKTYALVGHGWTQMEHAEPGTIRRSHPQHDGMLVSLGDMQGRAEKLCGKTHQSQ